MKIISKFHDYYDGVAKHGFDDTLVFERHTKRVELNALNGPEDKQLLDIQRRMHAIVRDDFAVIFFCGCVYPLWELHIRYNYSERAPRYYSAPQVVEMYQAIKDNHYVAENKHVISPDKNDVRIFFGEQPHRTTDHWGRRYYPFRFFTKDAIMAVHNDLWGKPFPATVFHKFGAPVLAIDDEKHRYGGDGDLIINPNLKDYDFQRFLDPYTAFQELSMFVGGLLSKEDKAPLRVGSDRDLALAKGFDDMSFRTIAPGQKKLNRKANKERKRNGERDFKSSPG